MSTHPLHATAKYEKGISGMMLQYQPTLADLLAFNQYHMAHSPSLRRYHSYVRIGTSLMCVVISLIMFFALEGSRRIPSFFYVFSLALGVAAYFVLPPLIWSSTKKRIERMFQEGQNKGMANPTTLSISPDGLAANNGLSQSTISWSAIERIVITAEYIFLYISAMNAVVIPQRAFATHAQRQECIQLLQQYHNSMVVQEAATTI